MTATKTLLFSSDVISGRFKSSQVSSFLKLEELFGRNPNEYNKETKVKKGRDNAPKAIVLFRKVMDPEKLVSHFPNQLH